MRVGGFPSRDEAIAEALAGRRRVNRRAWLFGVLGAFAAGAAAGSFAFGLWQGQRTSPRPTDDLATAHRLCRAPLAELVERYTYVLDAIDETSGDELLWTGARRLCKYALTVSGAAAGHIANELVLTLSYVKPPADLRSRVDLLRRRRGREARAKHEKR